MLNPDANTGGPTIAPAPMFPERPGNVYERKFSAARPGNRGPLRFEEGVATDTDVPNDFVVGMNQGYMTPQGRPNHNANVYEKWPEETMKERAHVGSAAWVESPQYLGEFSMGAASGQVIVYEENFRNGSHYNRMNPAVVTD